MGRVCGAYEELGHRESRPIVSFPFPGILPLLRFQFPKDAEWAIEGKAPTTWTKGIKCVRPDRDVGQIAQFDFPLPRTIDYEQDACEGHEAKEVTTHREPKKRKRRGD